MKRPFKKMSQLLVIACALLCGCDAHVDLANIDPSAKVDMGVALPVGEFAVQLGDFLGDTTVRQININDEGVYQFADTFSFSRRFHDLDLSIFKATAHEEMNVYEKAEGYSLVGGQTYVLDFPITADLGDINKQVRRERLDSLTIRNGVFKVQLTQNFNLEFDRIQSIELILSDDFHRAAGQTIALPITDYGTDMDVEIDNFSVNLMQDRTQPSSDTNVKSTVSMTVRFTIRLNDGETMTLQPDAAFSTTVEGQLTDYEALYGYFIQSEEMTETNTLSISEQWGGYYKIRQLNVSLAEPKIDLYMTTPVAAAIRCKISNLKVENKDRTEQRTASFNGSNTFEASLPNIVRVTDPIGATATNVLTFDQENGGIGHLAEIHPEYLSYDYAIMSETREGSRQQRLVNGMNYVDMKAAVSIPFKFNEGTKLEYKDTVSFNLEKVQLDSLVADIEAVDSISVRDLHMLLTLSNTLPFEISGKFRFLDANYQEMAMDLMADNSITVAGPTAYDATGKPEAGKGHLDVKIDDQSLELLPKIKYIEFDATVKDAGAPASVYPVSITPECGLKVHVALTADVSAYLKLVFGNNGEEGAK